MGKEKSKGKGTAGPEMTEGIIQKAFRKAAEEYTSGGMWSPYRTLTMDGLMQLEQDLIAEIKQGRDAELYDDGVFLKVISLRKLIGE